MANTPFLITGLPRSRTAWLAEAATIPGWSTCEHEPSIKIARHKDHLHNYMTFLAGWNERPGPYAGVSDYHLAHLMPNLLQTVKMRTLIVARPFAEVDESLRKVGLRPLSEEGRANFRHAMGVAIGNPLVRTLSYAELGDSDKLAEMLHWLMPEAPIDIRRIQALQSVHIEADLEANRKAWEASAR